MFLSTLITYINRGGAGFTTKAPMMTHNMNPTIERGEIRKTDTRKQVPLVSQGTVFQTELKAAQIATFSALI